MEQIFEWLWHRYGVRYRWAVTFATVVSTVTAFLIPIGIGFGLYLGRTALAVLVGVWLVVTVPTHLLLVAWLPDWTSTEAWASGQRDDPAQVFESTFDLSRAVTRGIMLYELLAIPAIVLLATLALDEPVDTTVEWGVAGLLAGAIIAAVTQHFFADAFLQPVRRELTTASGMSSVPPEGGRTYLSSMVVAVAGVVAGFTAIGGWYAANLDGAADHPLIPSAVGLVVALGIGLPSTMLCIVFPALQPIRELSAGIERVRAGDTTTPVAVTSDDDLGQLTSSFNQMQNAITERERLRSAFGTYVDPSLASRLLEQGDDTFRGERRTVTVMFIDIRDFTPFAEANPAEATVERLNALFEIVVPAVMNAGGHVNKYLGDGALAAFGAPNTLADHADAAVRTAAHISGLVDERFAGALRIGIGINTGQVIAGTIGGAGKLEFTIIGDTVNIAARVEQLTKATGDTILLTQQTLDALTQPPSNVSDRGAHALKGKAEPLTVHALTAQPTSAG